MQRLRDFVAIWRALDLVPPFTVGVLGLCVAAFWGLAIYGAIKLAQAVL